MTAAHDHDDVHTPSSGSTHNILLDTSALIDLDQLDERHLADSLDLPLVTRNPDGFTGLEPHIRVIAA